MSTIYPRIFLASLALVLILGATFAYQNGRDLRFGQVLGVNTSDLVELENASGYTNISPQELQTKLEQNQQQLTLLDVRTRREIAQAGEIANSQNIDYYDPEFEQKILELDPNQTYVVYCRSGQRSVRAAQIMSDNGFENLYNLAGGINAWTVSGYGTVK
jgi:rhodanese-related sulfurtransferase